MAGEGIHFLGDLSEFLILLKSLNKIDEFLTLLFLDLDGDLAGLNQEAGNDLHILFHHATSGQSWRAQSNTSWCHSTLVSDD